jgi:hypothetical protein
MPVLRYFSSAAQPTTLGGNYASGATSILVAATTGFPPTTPYTLALDYGASTEELVDVTAVAGTTLTVTRGVDGTSAQSHSLGAVVRHVASGRDFADYQTHQAATTGVHGVTGTLVGTSDTQTLSGKTLTSPTINSGAVSGTFTGTAVWSGLQTLNGGVASSGNIATSAQFTGTGATTGQDVFRGLVTSDVQNRFTIDADGRLEWGTGAVGRDTDLFRNGVGILQTSSRISAQRGTTGELAYHTQLQADTGSRWYLTSGGTHNWGDGAGLVDVNLYRSGADALKTDDVFAALVETTTSGLTAGGSFTIVSFNARRTCGVVTVMVTVSYTGSTITASASGNITDTLAATLPAGWRPTVATMQTAYDKGGVAQGSVSIGIDGLCTLKTLDPTATIASTDNVSFSLTFVA